MPYALPLTVTRSRPSQCSLLRAVFIHATHVLLCLCLLGVDARTNASAQQTPPQNTETTAAAAQGNALVLNSSRRDYDLGRHALTVMSRTGGIGYKQVIQRYRNNQLSRTDSYPMIRLGLQATPYWLVVPVKNATSREQWHLDFGRLSQGRSGLLAGAYVFEHNRQNEILDALPRDDNTAPLARQLNGSTVALELAPGQQHLLVFYLKAKAGTPGTMRLKLTPGSNTMAAQGGINFEVDRLLIHAPIILFFVLLGSFVMTRRLAAIAGAIFYGIQGAYFLIFDQLVFSTGTWPHYTMLLILPAAMLAGLVMLKDLYGLRREKSGAVYWSGIGLCAVTVVGALMGCILISQGYAIAGALAVFGPVAAVPAGAFWLALRRHLTKTGHKTYPDYLHIGAWCLLGLGFLTSALVHLGILPPGIYANNTYFYTLILHGVIMTSLCPTMLRPAQALSVSGDSSEMIDKSASPEPGGIIEEDKLRKSRHNAEHARLLRVIEREREILNQLRAQEKQQLEEMRKAKDAADNANEAKSAFLAVVSHEIRTPMTGIMGMVRLLENTRLTREQSEYVATIKDSGDAMMALLNDILDFEKIESGKLQLEMLDFDIVRMLKDIHKLMSGHAEAKNSTLELKIDDNVPKYVIGDSSRLRQILLNLVNNAIKFTENGTVTVQLSHLGQEENERGSTIHQLYLAVRDTGIGISPEAQDKLFTPFSQANASITRKYGGTGLGLAICKRLVEAMGADISLKSRPGEGSTFFFTLEMPEGVAESAIEAEDPGAALAGQGQALAGVEAVHVLIAEDNATNRKVIESFLAQQGHSCTSIENGKKALEALENDRFDILITDIEMQDMGGQELTKQLREHNDSMIANMPVVALTGNVRDEDIEAYRAAGMNDVLAKPVTPEALDHTLRRIQHGETLDSQQTPARQQAEDIPQHDAPYVSGQGEAEHPDTGSAENESQAAQIPPQSKHEPEPDQPQQQAQDKEDKAAAYYDGKVLDNLKANTSADGFQDMIESVFDETDRLLTALQEALSGSDWEGLRARAHELKGMSANFGMTRIAEIAGGIEKALRREESLDFDNELNTLREAASATREAVHEKLEQDAGVNAG